MYKKLGIIFSATLLSTVTIAAWDYSPAAKIATYQASLDACLPIDGDDAILLGRERLGKELERIAAEMDIESIKKTDEYKEIYKQGREDFQNIIDMSPTKEHKTKACKAIMGVDGHHL